MKQKKKQKSPCAIYRFHYFEKSQRYLPIFEVKALLSCLVSGAGAMYFAVLLGLETVSAAFAGAAAFLACGVFFLLLGLFRKLHVTLFAAAAALLLGFLNRTWLLECGTAFMYHAMYTANGNIINTFGFRARALESDPVPFMILLGVLFGIVCAFSASQRFHPEVIITFMAVMMVPAFLSETVRFYQPLAVFAAGIMGLWVMTASASANVMLSAGVVSDILSADRQYRKNNKKLGLKNKLRSDTLHFGKYLSDCVTVFITVLLIMGIASSAFPANGALKIQDLVASVVELGQGIGDWTYDIFNDLGFGGTSFDGFFSADGGSISISNSIFPDANNNEGVRVAEAVTQNTDKLYLRGDIGYSFDGDTWESISALDFSEIYYIYDTVVTYESGYSYNKHGLVSMETIFENYIPEIQYYLARLKLAMGGCIAPASYINAQTVKINYLKNFNTVLMPGTPCIFNFRSNENFNVVGDFVALSSSKINSMATTVLYSIDNASSTPMMEYIETFNNNSSISIDIWSEEEIPIEKSTYDCYIDSYEQFVHEYYSYCPDNEEEYVRELLLEMVYANDDNLNGIRDLNIEKYGYDIMSYWKELLETFIGGDVFDLINKNQLIMQEALAENIVYYLQNNFEYSLTTDNLSGDNTYLGNFLTETKSGHCALFATAMCLAMRYMGIPARYVTGFTVGGTPDYTDSDGLHYYLTEGDLHSWVEVYYDGVGWIPYDLTPAVDEDGEAAVTSTSETSSDTTTTTTTTAEITTTTAAQTSDIVSSDTSASITSSKNTGIGSGDEESSFDIRILLIIVGAVLLTAVIVLSVYGGLKSLERKEKALLKFFRSGNAEKAVSAMLTFALKLLEMQGIQRMNGETPTQFAERADRLLRQSKGITSIMPLFERAEFDNAPSFDEAERKQVYDCVNKMRLKLMNSVKAPRRLILRIKLFGGKQAEN